MSRKVTMASVGEAALAFESRWTLAALNRVDADIYARLREQRALFDEAMGAGDADEIELHGAAMVRGYRARLLPSRRSPHASRCEGLDRACRRRPAQRLVP